MMQKNHFLNLNKGDCIYVYSGGNLEAQGRYIGVVEDKNQMFLQWRNHKGNEIYTNLNTISVETMNENTAYLQNTSSTCARGYNDNYSQNSGDQYNQGYNNSYNQNPSNMYDQGYNNNYNQNSGCMCNQRHDRNYSK